MPRDEAFNNHSKLVLDSHDQISHSIERRELQIMAAKTR